MHQSLQGVTFHVEHIVPLWRSGHHRLNNLVWACPSCNLYKANRIESVDPDTSDWIPIFNLRRDRWNVHFRWAGYRVIGCTSVRRATIAALDLNHSRRVLIPQADAAFALFPQKRRCHPADEGLSMLINVLKYRDYYACIAYDPSADAFHGRVIGIQDVIVFYGRTPEELREEFRNSVEEYLAWCAQEGTKPEKNWLGKLTIRVDEDLHRRLAVAAAASGDSVNAWITTLLDRETRRVLKEHDLAG